MFNHRQRAPAFQFHSGSIKSWPRAHFSTWPRQSFNSIVVRLKVPRQAALRIVALGKFQFHSGSIKRGACMRRMRRVYAVSIP